MATDVEARTARLLLGEPACRHALYKMLLICETPRTTAEIERAALAFPEMKVSLHAPQILLSWLAGVGAVERVVAKEGKTGETERWQTTVAGKKVAEREAPAKRLLELLAEQPRYRDTYLQVLRWCEAPRTRAEVESSLQGNPVMEEPKVYASFFVQALEERGGLEWVEGHWRTTEAGKGVWE